MTNKVSVTVDLKYHRGQFDDCFAGGKIEYKGRICYWSAQDSNYGFGWEIDPVSEEDWSDINEVEFWKIIKFIEDCLIKHTTEYAGQIG